MNKIYISNLDNNFNCQTLFLQPYSDGFQNFCSLSNSSLSYTHRFVRLIGTGFLLFPLVNTIALIAIRTWQNYSNKKTGADIENAGAFVKEDSDYSFIDVIEAKMRIALSRIWPSLIAKHIIYKKWATLLGQVPNRAPSWLIDLVMAAKIEKDLSSDNIVRFACNSALFRTRLIADETLFGRLDSGNIIDICQKHPNFALESLRKERLIPFSTNPAASMKISWILIDFLITSLNQSTKNDVKSLQSVIEFLRGCDAPKKMEDMTKLFELIDTFCTKSEQGDKHSEEFVQALQEIARIWFSQSVYGDESKKLIDDWIEQTALLMQTEYPRPLIDFLNLIPGYHAGYSLAQINLGLHYLEKKNTV